jgi:hypothetical protein
MKRIRAVVADREVVAFNHHGALIAQVQLDALDAQAAERIARRLWDRVLLQAGVKTGPVTSLLVTTP